jgi:hypothetical protein
MALLALLVVAWPIPGAALEWQLSDRSLTRSFGSHDPSNPTEKTPRLQYRSVTAGTKSFRPVDPAPWADINKRVEPRAK